MHPPPLNPSRQALFLDFDGTLVGFAETPDAIQITAELRDLLDQLDHAFGGAMAFVTGRSAANLHGHLQHPFIIAGSHGAELRNRDGTVNSLASHVPEERGLLLRQFVDEYPELVMEEKAGGFTLHYRRLPSAKGKCRQILEELFGDEAHLEIMAGEMMWEVREKGLTKGTVIKALMAEPPFRSRQAVFVGDDVTDEDGFREVESFGGVSVKVGAGDTIAPFRLESIRAVHQWLGTAVAPKKVHT